MYRRSIFLRITPLWLVLTALVFGIASCNQDSNQNSNANTQANANKAVKVCDPSTDKAIEAAFQKLLENDPAIAPQMQQINYYSVGCVLTLQGWTNNITDFKTVLNFALATPDVAKVNFDAFWDAPGHMKMPEPGGGCQPGFKQCGDFCIPEEERCSIKPGSDNPKSTPKR